MGGSAISVYQALLHLPIESLGTRLSLPTTSENHLDTVILEVFIYKIFQFLNFQVN